MSLPCSDRLSGERPRALRGLPHTRQTGWSRRIAQWESARFTREFALRRDPAPSRLLCGIAACGPRPRLLIMVHCEARRAKPASGICCRASARGRSCSTEPRSSSRSSADATYRSTSRTRGWSCCRGSTTAPSRSSRGRWASRRADRLPSGFARGPRWGAPFARPDAGGAARASAWPAARWCPAWPAG